MDKEEICSETPELSYFAVVPMDVLLDMEMPANAVRLYGLITSFTRERGYCYASNHTLSEKFGWTEIATSRLVTMLEKRGHIIRRIIKDETGKVVRREIYLATSARHAQPLNNIVNTPQQNCLEGINRNVKERNISKRNIEKEDKEKGGGKRTPLTDEQLNALFVDWIQKIAPAVWTAQEKNGLYLALTAFYAPRETKKQEPARTAAAFTALSNRLLRYSEGSPTVMIDMLERATTAGWKSVYPIGGDGSVSKSDTGKGGGPEWI